MAETSNAESKASVDVNLELDIEWPMRSQFHPTQTETKEAAVLQSEMRSTEENRVGGSDRNHYEVSYVTLESSLGMIAETKEGPHRQAASTDAAAISHFTSPNVPSRPLSHFVSHTEAIRRQDSMPQEQNFRYESEMSVASPPRQEPPSQRRRNVSQANFRCCQRFFDVVFIAIMLQACVVISLHSHYYRKCDYPINLYAIVYMILLSIIRVFLMCTRGRAHSVFITLTQFMGMLLALVLNIIASTWISAERACLSSRHHRILMLIFNGIGFWNSTAITIPLVVKCVSSVRPRRRQMSTGIVIRNRRDPTPGASAMLSPPPTPPGRLSAAEIDLIPTFCIDTSRSLVFLSGAACLLEQGLKLPESLCTYFESTEDSHDDVGVASSTSVSGKNDSSKAESLFEDATDNYDSDDDGDESAQLLRACGGSKVSPLSSPTSCGGTCGSNSNNNVRPLSPLSTLAESMAVALTTTERSEEEEPSKQREDPQRRLKLSEGDRAPVVVEMKTFSGTKHKPTTGEVARTTIGLEFSTSTTRGVARTQRLREDAECPVCLVPYVAGDVVRLLPDCQHAFHAACIDRWLYSKATCPMCRDRVKSKLAAIQSETTSGGNRSEGPSYQLLSATSPASRPQSERVGVTSPGRWVSMLARGVQHVASSALAAMEDGWSRLPSDEEWRPGRPRGILSGGSSRGGLPRFESDSSESESYDDDSDDDSDYEDSEGDSDNQDGAVTTNGAQRSD